MDFGNKYKVFFCIRYELNLYLLIRIFCERKDKQTVNYEIFL